LTQIRCWKEECTGWKTCREIITAKMATSALLIDFIDQRVNNNIMLLLLWLMVGCWILECSYYCISRYIQYNMVWAVREGTRYEYRMVLWRHDMAREDRPPENNSLTDRQICTGKLFKTIIERSQEKMKEWWCVHRKSTTPSVLSNSVTCRQNDTLPLTVCPYTYNIFILELGVSLSMHHDHGPCPSLAAAAPILRCMPSPADRQPIQPIQPTT
jgi:hypothetical protein